MEYPIYNGESTVGIARVSKEGLYYRIHCHLHGSAPCRITAKAEHRVELGLCIPSGNTAGLEVRFPMKKLGKGNLSFHTGTETEVNQEKWYPISSEEPFPYLTKLKESRMVLRNGKVGITFKTTDQFPTQQDNDQNP